MSLREVITVPAHIDACAAAIRADLYEGPQWAKIPPEGIEAFTEDMVSTFPSDLDDLPGKLIAVYAPFGIRGALAEFIMWLPEVWEDLFAGGYLTEEPSGYEDEETGEWVEPDWADFRHIGRRDVVRALFGSAIAEAFC